MFRPCHSWNIPVQSLFRSPHTFHSCMLSAFGHSLPKVFLSLSSSHALQFAERNQFSSNQNSPNSQFPFPVGRWILCHIQPMGKLCGKNIVRVHLHHILLCFTLLSLKQTHIVLTLLYQSRFDESIPIC